MWPGAPWGSRAIAFDPVTFCGDDHIVMQSTLYDAAGAATALASEDLLDALFSLPDGLLIIGRDHHILFANQAARSIAPAIADKTGKDVRTCCGFASEDDDLWRGLDLVLNGGAFPTVERDLGSLTYRFTMIGAAAGALMIIHDSTRELQAARMRDALISTVSHELRTPLASIKGYATTLLRNDVTWDAGTQREFLEIIDEESDRLRELLDSFLDMSKLEAGVLRLERVPVHLARIARLAVGSLRISGDRYQVTTSFPRVFPLVECDPRRIEQVIRNLVQNAIKYAPNGCAVTVQGRVFDSLAAAQDDTHLPSCPVVVISVSDTGPGIAPADMDHLFERFRRAERRDQVTGFGLGLSICKGIVEAHGGTIWAQSKLGQGTTVNFALPLC